MKGAENTLAGGLTIRNPETTQDEKNAGRDHVN